MDHSHVASIGDFLIARAEREALLTRQFLDASRNNNEYFHEKTAAKIESFYNIELDFIKHYVELKRYYPLTALALEEQKPYLLQLWNDAERDFTITLPQ